MAPVLALTLCAASSSAFMAVVDAEGAATAVALPETEAVAIGSLLIKEALLALPPFAEAGATSGGGYAGAPGGKSLA